MQGKTSPEELARMVRETLMSLDPSINDAQALRLASEAAVARAASARYRSYLTVTGQEVSTESQEILARRVLGRTLPARGQDEPVLAWVNRCQNAAVEAALALVSDRDPSVWVEPTERGWLIVQRETGQRVEVFTRQREVQRE